MEIVCGGNTSELPTRKRSCTLSRTTGAKRRTPARQGDGKVSSFMAPLAPRIGLWRGVYSRFGECARRNSQPGRRGHRQLVMQFRASGRSRLALALYLGTSEPDCGSVPKFLGRFPWLRAKLDHLSTSLPRSAFQSFTEDRRYVKLNHFGHNHLLDACESRCKAATGPTTFVPQLQRSRIAQSESEQNCSTDELACRSSLGALVRPRSPYAFLAGAGGFSLGMSGFSLRTNESPASVQR
jgi:hypothetical protein